MRTSEISSHRIGLTHLVVHFQVEQVDGAALAVEHVLGLRDDRGHKTLQAHLLLEKAPGQG